MSEASSNNGHAQGLCQKCGLCCNGVIFADVKLQSTDDPAKLRSLGLTLTNSGRRDLKFAQPCVAFDGCRCRIYAERPRYCREFDCILLNNVIQGRVTREAALRIIGNAREKAEEVRGLLRALGDRDEQVALASRFRKITHQFESTQLDDETADLYGRLTLAVHDLNCLLSEAFYR